MASWDVERRRGLWTQALSVAVLLGSLSTAAFGGGFQLWEQNVTSVENFHAGRAVLANDASITYDNPAGITRIPNQQVVFGTMALMTNAQFQGSVSNCTALGCTPAGSGTVQAGATNFLPDLHYVAPLTTNVGFGLSVTSPYGLDAEYGMGTIVSNIITRARLKVVDITPALGFNVGKKLSLGLGFDIEKMSAELDSILPNPLTGYTTAYPSITKAYDTAYGYHLGALYEFSAATRIGMAYHSKVVHHLKGTSTWKGGVCTGIGTPCADRDTANVNLPPDTTLSVYRRLNPKWALMGTLVYTQWSVVNALIVNNIAGISGNPPNASPLPPYVSTLNFRNTMTFSIGADFAATENLTLRAGAGYDQTPTRNTYRNLLLPDNNRYDLAIGGHYQVLKTLGFDLGWTHVFVENASVNPPLQPFSQFPLQAQPNGRMKTSADVVGAQLVWDMV